jgi:hypothetical protein
LEKDIENLDKQIAWALVQEQETNLEKILDKATEMAQKEAAAEKKVQEYQVRYLTTSLTAMDCFNFTIFRCKRTISDLMTNPIMIEFKLKENLNNLSAGKRKVREKIFPFIL